ncbi:ABC transporter substrate-binding protein [bacterium]|nr:ABC transporter substrate-binding protein [bacterium]
MSGPKAIYGLSQLRGVELAASEINNSSFMKNNRIILIPMDDMGEPGRVGPLVTKLIYENKVIAMIGSVDSGCTHVISMMAVKSHTPHVTCVATDPSLTRAGNPWTFRTLADDERQASALVNYFVGEKRKKKIAIIAAQSRYGKMGAKTFSYLAIKAGAEVFGPNFLDPEVKYQNPELIPAVDKLLQMNPDVIVLWTLAKDALHIASYLSLKGFKGDVAGGDGLASPLFFASKAPSVNGTVITCPYDGSFPSKENDYFRAKFYENFQMEPDSFAAHAYDTLFLIAQGLSKSDGTRSGLRDAISGTDAFQGVTGKIRLDKSGNDLRPAFLTRCQDGVLIPIEK